MRPHLAALVLIATVPLTVDVAPATAAPPTGDFAAQVDRLRRVVACDQRGADAVAPPRGVTAQHLAWHCKRMHAMADRFAKRWVSLARPFFDALVPKGLPGEVVYPFGGADLMTALVVFPDLHVVTTLSLEAAGDPRGIDGLTGQALRDSLKRHRAYLGKLFAVNHNRTLDLAELSKDDPLASHLVFAMASLQLLGYTPVTARWFSLAPDGALVYVTAGERHDANAFANVELTFRRAGDADAPLQTWRHLQANLHDSELGADSPALAHLRRKGRVAAMTKAASNLLWRSDFSAIRDYLLTHMDWMVSESSGILPRHASAAGFQQQVWGRFGGKAFSGSKHGERAMIALWREHPRRKMLFFFGYPDVNNRPHLLVTAPAAASSPAVNEP